MVNALQTPSTERTISDRQLLERFVAGRDQVAFAGLVQRFGGIIWGVCHRVLHRHQDAEDAYQAVFILLARRAAAIRKREAVGSWLYGVAYRISMRAKRTASRRADREQRAVAPRTISSPPAEAVFRELHQTLDDEVHRLPDKYRSPFVLCCLEGMSKSEAARELGWKVGTVSGRVSQARQILQRRLARRGVAVSAALTAFAVAQGAASAAPPVVASTTSASASPAALAMADGFLRTLVAAKFKATIAVALTAATVCAAGVALHALQPDEPPKAAVPPPVARNPAAPVLAAKPAAVNIGVDEQVATLTFTADGAKLVTAGAWPPSPGQLKVWDVESGRMLASYRRIPGTRCLALSPDGRMLASGEFGGAIRLRDPDTGNQRTTLNGHKVGVNGLAFSPDGRTLASAGLDRLVKLWNVGAGKESATLSGHTDMIHSVAYFHRGDAIVTGGRDRTAIVWDVASGKPRHILHGHTDALEVVAVTADDKYVVTAGWDDTIRFWEANTGREAVVLMTDFGRVNALAFSPTGDLFAATGMPGVIRLWDAKTLTPVGNPVRQFAPVWSLTFSPDGQHLASGGSDRTAKIWDVPTLKEGTLPSLLTRPTKTFDTAENQTISDSVPYPPAGSGATPTPPGNLNRAEQFRAAERSAAHQPSPADEGELDEPKLAGRKKWLVLVAASMILVIGVAGLIVYLSRRSAPAQ
jgi:RNA polymerase sigma factor (sigma-70 family)